MRTRKRQVTLNTILLGNNLQKIRKKLNQMTKPTYSFTAPITIIALQQGIGKTHTFIEYAKNHWKNEKIILASQRHNHLEEIYKKLGLDKSRHWYGFSYQNKYGFYMGCDKLNQNIPLVNNLISTNNQQLLSPKYICNILGCQKNRCKYYITRGKSKKIDLIPLEYLGTDYLKQQKPDIVFIDEAIDKSHQTGKPVKYQVLQTKINDIEVRFVRVECHTEHKITTLGVPLIKQTETCKGAVAWTFGVDTEKYNPIIES